MRIPKIRVCKCAAASVWDGDGDETERREPGITESPGEEMD